MADAEKRVGIWLRVSTEDQVKGESLETHERRARAYAESRGWNVVQVYRLDAVSGKTVKEHPQAKRMLEEVRQGVITGLIFSKLARLARNTRELLDFSEHFRECGADLISLGESIDTSTPAGRLFFTILAAMATWEREEISARVAASVPIRAKMGKSTGGAAPLGYLIGEGSKRVVNPDEAPVVQLLFELYTRHKRKRTVARLLNERGYRTRGGNLFSDVTVERLLTNPIYKGRRLLNYTKSTGKNGYWTTKPEEEWIYQDVEAIVTADVWDEANAILAGNPLRNVPRRRTKQVVHLFAGIARCGCGAVMYVPSNSPKYTCRDCRNKIPAKDLELILKEELRAFVFSPEEIAGHVRDGSAQLHNLESLVSAHESDLRRLEGEGDKLIELYQSGLITKKDFAERYQKQRSRVEQIQEELPVLRGQRDALKSALTSKEDVLSGGRDLVERWEGLPLADKRHILEAILDGVVIGKGEVEFNFLYRPSLAV
jgi:site-specific DNA recombinase